MHSPYEFLDSGALHGHLAYEIPEFGALDGKCLVSVSKKSGLTCVLINATSVKKNIHIKKTRQKHTNAKNTTMLWYFQNKLFFQLRPGAGWAQMIAYAAFCETSKDQSPGSQGAAGDFGFKVLTSSDPNEKTKKLAAELANGRLAMMAIIGMFFQDGLTGSAWGDWALYTASPLRAFAGQQGFRDGKTGRANLVTCHAESIAATAIANGNFTILVAALKKAGLVETVSGTTPYTVFAPTDDAFKSLLKAGFLISVAQAKPNSTFHNIFVCWFILKNRLGPSCFRSVQLQLLATTSHSL